MASTLSLSVGLALLNSVPLIPFDGGRVTEAAIDSGLGGEAALRFRFGTSDRVYSGRCARSARRARACPDQPDGGDVDLVAIRRL